MELVGRRALRRAGERCKVLINHIELFSPNMQELCPITTSSFHHDTMFTALSLTLQGVLEVHRPSSSSPRPVFRSQQSIPHGRHLRYIAFGHYQTPQRAFPWWMTLYQLLVCRGIVLQQYRPRRQKASRRWRFYTLTQLHPLFPALGGRHYFLG